MNDSSKEMNINLKKKVRKTDPIWKNIVNWYLKRLLHYTSKLFVLVLWKRKIYKDILIRKMIYDMHVENEE